MCKVKEEWSIKWWKPPPHVKWDYYSRCLAIEILSCPFPWLLKTCSFNLVTEKIIYVQIQWNWLLEEMRCGALWAWNLNLSRTWTDQTGAQNKDQPPSEGPMRYTIFPESRKNKLHIKQLGHTLDRLGCTLDCCVDFTFSFPPPSPGPLPSLPSSVSKQVPPEQVQELPPA